tara:strand:- start:229 stop:573 length:345 start_codon:yes stop_codon:yes gene_type:complete
MPRKTTLAGDYALSVDKKELNQMIIKIREVVGMSGKIRTGTYNCERYSKETLRRSLYFSNNYEKSHIIKKSDLSFLRPYKKIGIKIEEFDDLIGLKLKKKVKKNQLIKKKYFQK